MTPTENAGAGSGVCKVRCYSVPEDERCAECPSRLPQAKAAAGHCQPPAPTPEQIRKACAKVCELEWISAEETGGQLGETDESYNQGVTDCVAAIRALDLSMINRSKP